MAQRNFFFSCYSQDCRLLQRSGLNKQENKRPCNPAAIPPDKRIRTFDSHPRSKATSFSSIQSQLQWAVRKPGKWIATFLESGFLRMYTVTLFAASVFFHANQPVPSRDSRWVGTRSLLDLSTGALLATWQEGHRRRTPGVSRGYTSLFVVVFFCYIIGCS